MAQKLMGRARRNAERLGNELKELHEFHNDAAKYGAAYQGAKREIRRERLSKAFKAIKSRIHTE